MQANYVQRLRIQFRKFGATRFIGHLDLALTWERCLNRAHMPIAYTQGFNRRPRMQLAAALPLGVTSDCEWLDIWLMEALDPAVAKEQISARIAPGLEIVYCKEVPLKAPALQNVIRESIYQVAFLDPITLTELTQKATEIMAAESLPRTRRKKQYDLRPLLLRVLASGSETAAELEIHVHHAPGRTGRPDEVLLAMGLDPLAARIHRNQLILGHE